MCDVRLKTEASKYSGIIHNWYIFLLFLCDSKLKLELN